LITSSGQGARVALAKTALDGHWRGLSVVAHALRDAGFEVILLGAALPEEIAAAVVQEDCDLVGLNVGGRIEVAERAIAAIRGAVPGMPIIAGGTLAPAAIARLRDIGVQSFPPGSSTQLIVETVHRLTTSRRRTQI
jgi:methylmalonyl-CoA mutase C-terminal domain/subunit